MKTKPCIQLRNQRIALSLRRDTTWMPTQSAAGSMAAVDHAAVAAWVVTCARRRQGAAAAATPSSATGPGQHLRQSAGRSHKLSCLSCQWCSMQQIWASCLLLDLHVSPASRHCAAARKPHAAATAVASAVTSQGKVTSISLQFSPSISTPSSRVSRRSRCRLILSIQLHPSWCGLSRTP